VSRIANHNAGHFFHTGLELKCSTARQNNKDSMMKLFSRLRNSKLGSSIAYHIHPRKVKFEWQDTPIDWIPNQPYVSYFINEINMILPAGEFWFCRLYNKVLPQIQDEKLKQDVQAFIRQEAMHAQAHNSANKEYLTVRNIDIQRNLDVMDFLFS